jgi:predicted ferric reductase
MDMDSMGGTAGVPGYFYMQKQLWVVIGSVIAFATLINVLNFLLLRQRLRSANARPKSWFWRFYATATAITRELSQSSLPSHRIGTFTIRSPQLGKTLIVLSWMITILVFCFYQYDTFDQWSWEDIAYRCGCVALAQLPLVFLLAGKQNLIGYLAGTSYERLNWLHRWVARILWMTVTIHMGFWFRSWARYDYIVTKLKTDYLTQTGFASWVILTAILLTSFYPMRRSGYEIFVILHITLFAGLVGAIYLHTEFGFAYIWACVGIFFLDRLLRIFVSLWANLSFLHPGRRGLWANQATLTPLPGNVTRISIDSPVIKWQPGQHMFLSCHSVVPLQSHPFTASSLPSDGRLEFLIQARTGGTRRFHRWASKYHRLPDSESTNTSQRKYVGVEGPYGSIRPLLQFDSIVFFAGSTGASFTIPLMRDIVRRWKHEPSRIVTKRIKFVWVIKAKDRLCWFEEQIQQALRQAAEARSANAEIELDLGIYVTCDEKLEPTDSASTCSPPPHGEARLATTPGPLPSDEEEKALADQVTNEREVGSSSDTSSNDGCSPDGGCCCKKAVDEDGIAPTCCCRREVSKTPSSASPHSSTDATSKQDQLKLHTGRPKVRPIIRRLLEEAEGESAVVVCGPQGLQDDVRRSVVALSDERAVHKGTGAQGVYLHVEGFSY